MNTKLGLMLKTPNHTHGLLRLERNARAVEECAAEERRRPQTYRSLRKFHRTRLERGGGNVEIGDGRGDLPLVSRVGCVQLISVAEVDSEAER
jgi:hypothetical protein